MASHVPDPGFVYIARAERSGLVKIGHSHNVSGRLRSLKASVREPVVLLAVLRGWRDTERALLARVKAHRDKAAAHRAAGSWPWPLQNREGGVGGVGWAE